jgi:hypothetical protein
MYKVLFTQRGRQTLLVAEENKKVLFLDRLQKMAFQCCIPEICRKQMPTENPF